MYTPLFLSDSELILIACHDRLRIKQAKDAIPERINRVYTDRCVAKLETGEWACCVWLQGMHVLEFQCIATYTTLQQALQWLIGEREPASGCDVAGAIPHLPAVKQQQLCEITRIIRATADVERVVLFGSHARGDWVDDPAGGYISDYDVRSVSHKWRERQGLGTGWKGMN